MNFKIYHIPTRQDGQIYAFAGPLNNRVKDFAVKYLNTLGVKIVVNLLSESENNVHALKNQRKTYEALNIKLEEFPIQDFNTPASPDNFKKLIRFLSDEVIAGKSIGIHCMAGVGRTGILAVSLLCALGMGTQEAMEHVSQHRECKIPDTEEQMQWLQEFNQR
ncbi:MAG: dual specificity protein phosphatase family protein [Chitinophagales bacterium]|nr:dual specificity protein phosphatase family protein [Chitinophagales bacterium]